MATNCYHLVGGRPRSELSKLSKGNLAIEFIQSMVSIYGQVCNGKGLRMQVSSFNFSTIFSNVIYGCV